ncbi:hypothetical protein HMPREF1608_01406 [Escherichia coli 908525]|nr:hypothetical protein HMPREF1595_02251 [Escherichia coli 907672]ESD76445.1 hypothetical protein HMPREF1608_01406 [Escherichia coli 908525]
MPYKYLDKRDNILNEKMIRHYTHFAYKQTEIIHTPNNSCDLKYKSQEAILITRSTTGAGYKLSPTFHNVQK